MANKRIAYPRRKKITLTQQMVNLQMNYPSSTAYIRGHKQLVWWGNIRPSRLSQTYTVNITYELSQSPQVWVIGDELEGLEDPSFPHKYEVDIDNKKVRICLYRYREFDSYKLLSDTIIPWAAEWLFHYEIWLATGLWCGGGDHPPDNQPKVED